MHYTTPLLTALLALMAAATPLNVTLAERGADTFNIQVWNNCKFTKRVALYQITPDFKMIQKSNPTNIEPKCSLTIPADFKALGMRLSGHAEWGTDRQWNHQALFEFGYSTYGGKEGTAYDLSVMQGSDGDIGIGAYPFRNGRGSRNCLSKTCFPWSCPLEQGWTRPDQVKQGSPADTVCYYGKTDFKVVFCP